MTNYFFFSTVAEHLPPPWLLSKIRRSCFVVSVLLIVIIIGTSATAVLALDCVSLSKKQTTYNLDNSIIYFEDKTAAKSFKEIRHIADNSWLHLQGDVPNFGFSSSAYWLQFSLCQNDPSQERITLEIEYPLLDSIDLFGVQDDNLIYQVHSGDRIPFKQRQKNYHTFLFNLPDLDKSPLRIYIRVQTESAVQVPLNIYTLIGLSDHTQKVVLVQGIYFGIILAMILSNAFLFLAIREMSYLYYVCFTMSYFCFQTVLQGFFQQFLLGSVWWQNHALLIFGFGSITFANMFARAFLQLKQKKPILSQILCGISWLAAIAAPLASMLPYVHMVKLMLTLSVFSSLLIMFAGFSLWMAGHMPARIFTFAWLPLLISFILASMNKFALLPRSFWTENIMQIGGVLEVILLSFALGIRINEEKQQRILIEQRLSSSLEEEVKERTVSLNKALKELEVANSILDKMSLTDSLTELSNRRAFDYQFEIDYQDACHNGLPLSLLLLDIDHFKRVNDTHGHQAGDQVLQAVAQALSSLATRSRDNVYRYGGEEFAVVLNNTSLNGSMTVAEKMRELVQQLHFTFESEPCSVTISIGICGYIAADSGEPMPEFVELIKEADGQLYQAKENGRNRVETTTIRDKNVS